MADKIIVVIDARPGSAPGETRIAVPPESPWHELLPNFQVVEANPPRKSAPPTGR